MAKAWLVSCHAGTPHETSKGTIRHLFPGAKTFSVPPKMEIVFYCPGDRQLSMNGGWKLWDMLMYGESGGEQMAYAANYKIFGGNSTVSNYSLYKITDDAAWDDGSSGARGNAHPDKNTYGIWKVGDPSKPVIPVKEEPMLLSEVVGNAVFSGVQRIYFGACRAHWKNKGPLTSASNIVYTPSGLT